MYRTLGDSTTIKFVVSFDIIVDFFSFKKKNPNLFLAAAEKMIPNYQGSQSQPLLGTHISLLGAFSSYWQQQQSMYLVWACSLCFS